MAAILSARAESKNFMICNELQFILPISIFPAACRCVLENELEFFFTYDVRDTIYGQLGTLNTAH